MKKILVAAVLALSLGGCATFQTFENNVKTAWSMVTSASVSPTQIIVAANGFNAVKATATQYLLYCKSVNYVPQACSLSNRQVVVKSVRAGTVARNQLEPYVTSGTAGPAAIYNTLVSVISSLQASNLPVGAK